MYWIWNCKIILPFYKNEDPDDATKKSLIYLFDNGSNINKIFNNVQNKFVKNETLFNMIIQNKNMNAKQQIQLLIDYKFDFVKLINVYDNIKQQNGLILFSTYLNCYAEIKLLIDHCKTLNKCNIDIKHSDIFGNNALFI